MESQQPSTNGDGIPELDQSLDSSKNSRHAVVIGGSIAGLLAARVLLQHFERVTLIERDRIPTTPSFRSGVPQSQHVHGLLIRGQRLLEQLFPGLVTELQAAGAPSINWTGDFQWLGIMGWFPRCPADLSGIVCSRIFLETSIYGRLRAEKNLTILEACQVRGLLTSPDQSKVLGVQLTWRDDHQQPIHPQVDSLVADLVVDASGRNSALPKWLTHLGYATPRETVINAFLGYSSRWYQRPEGLQVDWKGIILAPDPAEHSRTGILFPVEGDRWILTMAGVAEEQPPTDEQEFLEFARSLRAPFIYDAIREAKPLSPVYSYRRTENRWRHYEELSRLPEGILAIGDAVCAFNPVYGQGMTSAALGAFTLDRCLQKFYSPKQNLKGLNRHFQKQLAQVLSTPWAMATGEDYRWAATEGPKQSWTASWVQKYIDQVILLATKQPAVFQAFTKVVHMIEPPATLFHPKILGQVVSHYFHDRLNKRIGLGQEKTR